MPNIEYLPGIEAGQKIDLDKLSSSRFENKRRLQSERYLPALQEQLVAMSGRLKNEYGDFFSSDGQIKMQGEDAFRDKQEIEKKENQWAKEKLKSRAAWRAERDKNPAALAETALTLLFDRILRDDFIVVRAAAFDDYKNGVDQLIIDKRTGAVICGLDDVLGHQGDDGAEKKADILAKRMTGGGTKIKYGLRLKDGNLEVDTLKNIPLFYFSLSKAELLSLLDNLNDSEKLDPASLEIFNKLVVSLDSQFKNYSDSQSLAASLQANLQKFRPSLDKILSYARPN